MEYTRLGNSQLRVSRLALGGCPLGGHGWGRVDDQESVRAVRAALEEGVNFFDTADVYGLGHSEEILSRALGDRRHDVVIATKFGVRWDDNGTIVKDISAQYLRQALEASLRRLRIDCIPLYYVHWPDGHTPIEAAIEDLARCQEAGKIQAIGVSNFLVDEIQRAQRVTDIACLQAQLSLVDRDALSLTSVLKETRTSLVTWGSLAQGLLSGKYDRNATFELDDRRHRYENFRGEKFQQNLAVVETVKQVAQRNNRTPAQVAMRWLLDTSAVGVVLFGAKTSRQVHENVGASGWSLSEDDYQQLTGAQRSLAA